MPTTNPVPSTDPTDLLFNAGKLDEVVNGTANSFTDRLGIARRTVAGMSADFDAQLADAESDLNVYRADAAASAAEALGYLQTIRATSYGAYASDPATDPLGNPPTVGDEYFNTTANLLKRWNGTTWQASDINTANLAASSGSSLVGYDGGTVQDVLDGAKSLQDYAALRAYTGRATRVYITGLLVTAKPAGIAGIFQYDPTDTTSSDNGGTIIVGADGRRWKRNYDGSVNVVWFGADNNGIVDSTYAIQSALNVGKDVFIQYGDYVIDPLTGVSLVSNQKITMENGAVLRCAPSDSAAVYSVIKVLGVSNVLIQGGTIVGDRTTHIGTAGESGMGIYIANSSNVTVRDVQTVNCWGDGIYVGGTGTTGKCTNVLIENVKSYNNRRQGLTIAAADGVLVDGGWFTNTNGVAPEAGIDIEPNPGKGEVSNVVVRNANCDGNNGCGIAVSQTICNNVKLIENTVTNNGLNGIQSAYIGSDLLISGNTVTGNADHGISIAGDNAYITREIDVLNNTVKNNGKTGIRFNNNITRLGVKGNKVFGNGWHGLSFEGGLNLCDDGFITENHCESNSQSANATYDNIYVGALCHFLRVSKNICRRGALTNKPAYGIRVTNNEANFITDNDLYLAGATGNYIGVFANVTLQQNIGFKTENRVLSDAFPVDVVNTVTVTIPHGCAYTPATHHCSLTIVAASAFPFAEGFVTVQSVDANNVTARVSVTTAAGAGSTARLALFVSRPSVL